MKVNIIIIIIIIIFIFIFFLFFLFSFSSSSSFFFLFFFFFNVFALLFFVQVAEVAAEVKISLLSRNRRPSWTSVYRHIGKVVNMTDRHT